MNDLEILLCTLLLNAAWQVPVLTGAAVLASRLAAGASGRLRHALWVLALLLASSLPILTMARIGIGVDVQRQASFAAPGSSALDSPAATTPLGTVTLFPPAPIARALAWLYVGFLAHGLGRLAWGWLGIHRLRSRSLPATPEAMEAAQQAGRALRLPGIQVRRSPDVMVPIALGIFRPLVLLPEGMPSTPRLLAAVIGHELAHIRRRDPLWQLVLQVVSLPISFHPVIAVLRRGVHSTRERACDEEVVPALASPRVYAGMLLELAGWSLAARRPVHALAAVDGSALETRIALLLDEHPRRRATLARVIVLLAILAFSAVTASAVCLRVDEAGSISPSGSSLLDLAQLAGVTTPDAYGYEPGRRRDPFMNLSKGQAPPRHGTGLARFLAEEVALRGIVETRGKRVALLAAPDGRSYFASAGSRLFDAVVLAVDRTTVTLRQEIADPLSTDRTRIVRFLLHEESTTRAFSSPR